MKIQDILFWIFLILGVILIVWNIFGDSPTEFFALLTLMFTLLLKTWSISNRTIKFETRFNTLEKSFIHLSNDFKKYIKN